MSQSATNREIQPESEPPDSGVTHVSDPSSESRRQLAERQYNFVQVNDFRPNVDGWQVFGDVVSYELLPKQAAHKTALRLVNADGFAIQVSFLSPTALRVQFRPQQDPDYSPPPNPQAGAIGAAGSYAVVDRNLGEVSISAEEVDRGGRTLLVKTGQLEVYIGLEPYGMAIYREGQLITEDTYGKNLIFSNQAVACLRKSPDHENYFGFGEKAGVQLNKKHFTMSCFNYDNFKYDGASGVVVPQNNTGGPLNPTEPLYNSMPFFLAIGASDTASSAQSVYAYGLFFDNVSQSYFNMGANDYSDMSGKYYFGALYGDLDYYLLIGQGESTQAIRSVLGQYSKLTGPSALPPKYAFGYQQGCYGYYNEGILLSVAQAYRAHRIPIDGLHIDVDFQNNYRTFTHSPEKFPRPKQMFDLLHSLGFKCSTNITGIISSNPLDEKGRRATPDDPSSQYPTRDRFVSLGESGDDPEPLPGVDFVPFLRDLRDGQADPQQTFFVAEEYYGTDETPLYPEGHNPYPAPTPASAEAVEKQEYRDNGGLGTYGFYCDLGDPKVAQWWGQQYRDLLDWGLDMVWQDMTCPAVVPNFDDATPVKTLPLDLLMYDPVTGKPQPNAKVHNAFALNLVRATYEGLTALRSSAEMQGEYNHDKRNFIIARGGYAGIHRYGGIWTGDSASSWDFLRINIPEVLNIGLSGQPISGCDVGGFANGSGSRGDGVTDYELFTRWMTMSAFLPWYRNHYDGYTKLFQEPYRYGDPVPANCRKYIELRYRLIQLFYDAMYQNTVTGLPICRALFVNDAHDPNLTPHLDQSFFVGDSLLVAPVVEPGSRERDVYLPSGSQWYVFNDNRSPLGPPTQGGTTQRWYVPLDLVPLYVREGAILPLRELEQYVGELPQNPITFNIYPGRDSEYLLYQDDQTTTAHEAGSYRLTKIRHEGSPGRQTITIERLHDEYRPPEDFFYLALLGTSAPKKVILGGELPDRGTPESLNGTAANGYYFNASLATTYVKVMDEMASLTITVEW